MGRGTIAGGGAAGLYSLALDVGVAERTAAVAQLDERLAVLVEPIAVLEASLAAAEAARDAARDAAHAAIDAYAAAMQADPAGDHSALADEVQARTARAIELEGVAAQSRIALQMLQAEQAQLQRDRAALLAVPVERTVDAWCVDLTENASGAVATVEVPGEPAQVLIAPGGRAPADADGRLLARGMMSPAQAFWNAAVLPGWQKWKPDYRTGTLTALDQDNDRATVALDALTSSAQGLRVNQADTLVDVPVVYMTCNAQAFEVGDRVVVQFDGRDWANPRVIGFVDHPQACEAWGWGIAGGGYLRSLPWDAGEEAGPVDYRWRPTPPDGGNVSWYGNGKTVSWWGRVGKHVGVHVPSRVVYCDGVALNFGFAIDYVRGACARVIGGVVWVYAVGRAVRSTPALSWDRMYRVRLDGGLPELLWEANCAGVDAIAGEALSETPANVMPVMFGPDGLAAVSVAYASAGAALAPAWVVHYTESGRTHERIEPVLTRRDVYESQTDGFGCQIARVRIEEVYTGQVVAAEYDLDGVLRMAEVEYELVQARTFESASYTLADVRRLVVGDVVVGTYSMSQTYDAEADLLGRSWSQTNFLTLDLRNPQAACRMTHAGTAAARPPGFGVTTVAAEWGMRLVGDEEDEVLEARTLGLSEAFEPSLALFKTRCADVPGISAGTYEQATSLFLSGQLKDAVFFVGGNNRLSAPAQLGGGDSRYWVPGPTLGQFSTAFAPNGDFAVRLNGFEVKLGPAPASLPVAMVGEFTDTAGLRFASNAFGLEAFLADAGKTLEQVGELKILTR